MIRQRRTRRLVLAGTLLLTAAGAVFAVRVRNSGSAVPTVAVTRGEFIDYLALRGSVKANREVMLPAPAVPTDLQIVQLVQNGATVRQGDVMAAFDSTQLQRDLDQHETDLRQADAQVEGIRANARSQEEQDLTDLAAARFNVERAKLDVSKQEILSQIDGEKAKLALADAEQAQRQAEEKLKADRAGFAADLDKQRQVRDKALFDVNRQKRWIQMMTVRAPINGMVTLENNTRMGNGGMSPQWKVGDRAWAGAQMVALPDLGGGLRFEAAVEESDRGQLRDGQEAVLRVDAVSGADFAGKLSGISPLTKPDFTTWPPPQNFIATIELVSNDARLRPGMSATARVTLERMPNTIIVPAEAVFLRSGRNVVFVQHGSAFDERTIEVARRNREKVAIARGVSPGEKVATRDPFAGGPEGAAQ
ncbi:MAG: efflux RND transporter periplasmic adaptor subunit [Acidobacteria bacterium]|nr:efflux RND transporter periplasmic adaptor subunit [Acidobacteriota bacterium]